MKFVQRPFPSVVILVFALSLYAQDQQIPSTSSAQERDAQIRQLQQQLDDIAAPLTLLEAQPASNPRGPTKSNEAPQLPPAAMGGGAATAACLRLLG